jgi:spore coat polysaccharide biosynthesis protein SpsF (cytidylyltransferase family)
LTSKGKRIVAVVQARASSQRFPQKILADVGGSPLLARLLRRLRSSSECDALAVATSTGPDDDAVAAIADAESVGVVRGPLDDVLERYRIAAETLDADAVVRVTGDCPLVDAGVVDSVIRAFRAAGVHYVSNVRPPTFPDGLDVEVISRDALERAAHEATRPSEREHVTLYIAEHPELFRSQNVTHAPDHSAMRWTVDYPDDLEFVRGVFRTFTGREETFSLEDVLAALANDDALARLMPTHSRNEGLAQSLTSEVEASS